MRILAIGVLVIVALLNSRGAHVDARQIEWRYFDDPSGAAPQALSERMVARHLLEAEDALADLESEEDDNGQGYNSCPAPNRDTVKVAIQEEIERLKNDPSALVGNENEAIREHRAMLEAYDNLRQSRGSSLVKSSFVENVAKRGADDRNANVAAQNDDGVNLDEANVDVGANENVNNDKNANVDEENVDDENVALDAHEDDDVHEVGDAHEVDNHNADVDEAELDEAEYEGEDNVDDSDSGEFEMQDGEGEVSFAESEARVRVKRNPQYEQSEEEFDDDGVDIEEEEDQDHLEDEDTGYQPSWQQANVRDKRAN